MKAAIETAGHGTYGPFRDEKTAADWANKHVSDATWRLIKLREPAGLTLDEMGLRPETARSSASSWPGLTRPSMLPANADGSPGLAPEPVIGTPFNRTRWARPGDDEEMGAS